MMVVLTHFFGHPYVDGVGYGVIQSTLDNKMTPPACWPCCSC